LENSFIQTLKSEENAAKEGFDGSLWRPHKSAEGGSDTIGYGHKLQKGEDFSEGITEAQAEALLKSDLATARKNASKVEGFDKLEEKYQLALTEIEFNAIGDVTDWTKLIAAMKAKDDDEVRKQMSRTFTDKKGNKKKLSKRVKAIADVLKL
jgi:GH24 family phage-related lysozyme (muramidase)